MPIHIPTDIRTIDVLREGPRAIVKGLHAKSGGVVHARRARSRAAALREARLLRKADSPFTPRFAGLASSDGEYWILTDWIDGTPLDHAGDAPADWPTQLLRALSHLHRRGIVHGDVKPGNVLVTGTRIILADFDRAAGLGSELSHGDAGGTPGFVAPERLSGWPADPRGDLYSYAVTLGVLGRRPRGLAHLLGSLEASTPGLRPERADLILGQVAATFGPGPIPEPDLTFAGWRTAPPDPERLARGWREYLGIDPAVSSALARAFLEESGRYRPAAQWILEQWLPRVAADPWQNPTREPGAWSGQVLEIERLAGEEAAARIERLAPATRKLVARMAHGDAGDDGIADGARDAAAIGVLRPAGAPESWRLSSTAMREAALKLDAEDTASLHRARIRLLINESERDAAASPGRSRQLGWHYERSGDRALAESCYFEAGEAAFREGRFDLCLDHMSAGWTTAFGGEAALPDSGRSTRVPEPDGSALRAIPRESTLDRIDAFISSLALAGRHREGEAWLLAMAGLCEGDGERARYHRACAEASYNREDHAGAARHARAGLALLDDVPSLAGALHLHRAQALIASHRLRRGEEALRKSEALLNPDGDPRFRCAALLLRGIVAYRRADLAGACREWERCLDLATRESLPYSVGGAHLNLSVVRKLLGDDAAAEAHLSAATGVAERHSYHALHCQSLGNMAEFALLRSDFRSALELNGQGLRLALQHQRIPQAVMAYIHRSRALVRSGRIAEAEKTVEEAMTLPEPGRRSMNRLRLLIERLQVTIWIRRRPCEAHLLAEARSIAAGSEMNHERAELDIAAALNTLMTSNDPGRALLELGDPPLHRSLAGWHHLARARILAAASEAEGALAEIAAADGSFRGPGAAPYEQIFSLLERGFVLSTVHRAEAWTVFENAAREARRIGARWIEAQALVAKSRLYSGASAGQATPGPATGAPQPGDEE